MSQLVDCDNLSRDEAVAKLVSIVVSDLFQAVAERAALEHRANSGVQHRQHLTYDVQQVRDDDALAVCKAASSMIQTIATRSPALILTPEAGSREFQVGYTMIQEETAHVLGATVAKTSWTLCVSWFQCSTTETQAKETTTTTASS